MIIVAVIGYFAMKLNQQMAELARVSGQADVVRNTAEALRTTQDYLDQEIQRAATSEIAVEQWAYEEADMAKPGDQLIVPLAPGESTPTPQPRNEVTHIRRDNWQIWRDLFFGPDIGGN